MNFEQAIVPHFLVLRGNRINENIMSIVCGVFIMSLLAQLAIYLPGNPVPVTGQTLGVLLISIIWGRKRAFTVLLSYLTLGALGLPIFALGKWGIYGPSFGYLLGMLICSVVVGYFSDSGYAKTFSHVFILSGLGTLIIYFFGLIGLTFYVKKTNLLSLGVYPFLIGDLLKIIVISLSVKKISAFYQKIKI